MDQSILSRVYPSLAGLDPRVRAAVKADRVKRRAYDCGRIDEARRARGVFLRLVYAAESIKDSFDRIEAEVFEGLFEHEISLVHRLVDRERQVEGRRR